MPANPLSSLKRAMRINSSTYVAGLGLRGMAGNIRSFVVFIYDICRHCNIPSDRDRRPLSNGGGLEEAHLLAASQDDEKLYRSSLSRPQPALSQNQPYSRSRS
jgi:hypothetical protein